jgi:hypothetical protein
MRRMALARMGKEYVVVLSILQVSVLTTDIGMGVQAPRVSSQQEGLVRQHQKESSSTAKAS